jgi:hypothetical protein
MARKVVIPGYFPPQVAAKATAIGPLVLGTAGRAAPADRFQAHCHVRLRLLT